jgi:cell division protein FtsB
VVLAQEQEMAQKLATMLEKNTALTEQVATLTEELHATICRPN